MHRLNWWGATAFLGRKSGWTINYHPLYWYDKHLLRPSVVFTIICSFFILKDYPKRQTLPKTGVLNMHSNWTFWQSWIVSITVKSKRSGPCIWNIPKCAWVHLWEPIWEKLFTNKSIDLLTKLGQPLNCTYNTIAKWRALNPKAVYEVHK